jgi:hypothetical protein
MLVKMAPGETKPDYVKKSLFSVTTYSMKNMILGGFQGGAYAQNGGEWLFEDGKLVWCRRMRNTEDHSSVAELKEVLGMSAEE